MKKLLNALLLAGGVLALGACATYKDTMPAWMPGSNAVSVKLSGAEEAPPVSVSGSGSGSLRLAEDGSLTGSVSTKDVQGTMAHIHRGAKGQNGPVIVPLEKKGDTYSVPAGGKLTEAQIQDWKAGNLYVNVHTARHKGGEVRGQINP
ncbi:MAG: CHRD domain-containing protein [Betaproteobacteria bacterium]